jgi:hypothetical protein
VGQPQQKRRREKHEVGSEYIVITLSRILIPDHPRYLPLTHMFTVRRNRLIYLHQHGQDWHRRPNEYLLTASLDTCRLFEQRPSLSTMATYPPIPCSRAHSMWGAVTKYGCQVFRDDRRSKTRSPHGLQRSERAAHEAQCAHTSKGHQTSLIMSEGLQ